MMFIISLDSGGWLDGSWLLALGHFVWPLQWTDGSAGVGRSRTASRATSELVGPGGPQLGLSASAPRGGLPSSSLARACPWGSRVPREQEQKPPGLETQAQRPHSHFSHRLLAHTVHKASPEESRCRNRLHCLMEGAAKEVWWSAIDHKHRIVCWVPREARETQWWGAHSHGSRVADTLCYSLNFCICLKISIRVKSRDFLGGPVAKNLRCSAGGVGT